MSNHKPNCSIAMGVSCGPCPESKVGCLVCHPVPCDCFTNSTPEQKIVAGLNHQSGDANGTSQILPEQKECLCKEFDCDGDSHPVPVCSCKVHHSPKDTKPNWEKELEKKFPKLLLIEYVDGREERIEPMYSELKQFISQTLHQARDKGYQEGALKQAEMDAGEIKKAIEKERERLLEKIGKLDKSHPLYNSTGEDKQEIPGQRVIFGDKDIGYNQAIQEVKQLLTTLQERG